MVFVLLPKHERLKRMLQVCVCECVQLFMHWNCSFVRAVVNMFLLLVQHAVCVLFFLCSDISQRPYRWPVVLRQIVQSQIVHKEAGKLYELTIFIISTKPDRIASYSGKKIEISISRNQHYHPTLNNNKFQQQQLNSSILINGLFAQWARVNATKARQGQREKYFAMGKRYEYYTLEHSSFHSSLSI